MIVFTQVTESGKESHLFFWVDHTNIHKDVMVCYIGTACCRLYISVPLVFNEKQDLCSLLFVVEGGVPTAGKFT
jgi:hypothetical protein